jgi:hypothetical protein
VRLVDFQAAFKVGGGAADGWVRRSCSSMWAWLRTPGNCEQAYACHLAVEDGGAGRAQSAKRASQVRPPWELRCGL